MSLDDEIARGVFAPRPLDLDALRKNSVLTRDGFYHVVGNHHCLREADFDALVAEVERLRHEVADLQMLRDEHLIDNLHATEEGRNEERAAVVAWLEKAGWMPSMVEVFRRGEHRREDRP